MTLFYKKGKTSTFNRILATLLGICSLKMPGVYFQGKRL